MYFSRPIRFSRTLVCGLFKNPWFSCRRYFKVPLPILLAGSPLAPNGSAAKTLIRARLQYRQLRRLVYCLKHRSPKRNFETFGWQQTTHTPSRLSRQARPNLVPRSQSSVRECRNVRSPLRPTVGDLGTRLGTARLARTKLHLGGRGCV